MSDAQTHALAATPVGQVRWLIVLTVFVVAAVSYLDRNNISIAASFLQREFGLSNIQLGGLFSAFALGYAIMQPLAGRVADRFGPYRLVAGAVCWWTLFTVLVPFVPVGLSTSFGLLLGLRFLLGLGEAIIFPASNRLVASWIPRHERGMATGIIFAGVGVGGGITPPLVTYVILNYGWRAAFLCSGLLGLLACALWLLVVRNRPDQHKWLGTEESAYIAAGVVVSPDESKATPRWSEILLDRQVALLTLGYFCYGYVAYIFFTWFFKYLSDVRGLDLKASAFYAMLPFIAMAVASFLGGLISDKLIGPLGRRTARCGVAGVSLAMASVFIAVATQIGDARVAALVLAGGAGALYLAQSAFWAISADIGGRCAGTVSGVMNMGCQLGGVLTATQTPILADAFGWSSSFWVSSVICAIGAGTWLFIDPSHTVVSGRTRA
jgi:ACS family glucarate transporter-like MFS transporter